jgi:hypothetical protein
VFTDPRDWAHAAQDLLANANGEQTERLLIATELGAALIANHVWDWHERTGQPPQDKVAFKTMFPEWELLRTEVANSFKHAKTRPDFSQADLRCVEFEDDDFFYAEHGHRTVFIEVDGRWRSLSALLWKFAFDYIQKT